jgi:DNA-binding transcriptional LysR family regulator
VICFVPVGFATKRSAFLPPPCTTIREGPLLCKLYDPIAVFGISDNDSSMELRHLRYFSAVAEYLNYSEASRRLHVAQAAISQTIVDLEEELEARLLSRTKRKVQLTAAGAIFLKEAEEILRRADQAKRLVRRGACGEVGTLSIGFLGPATSQFLPALIQEYRSKYPDVELRLQHLNPDQQLAAFDEGSIDVGLSRSLPPERRTSFNETTIYTDYLMVALPGAHPLAKERAIKLKKLGGAVRPIPSLWLSLWF